MHRTAALPTALLDLNRLPALPQILSELIEACNNNEIDIYSVGELVARDAAISARILQLANSAFLGTKAAFAEIEQAVIYLGIDTVRNLAVSVSVHEAFSTGRTYSGLNMAQFWYHSLLTAILAKNLAEAAGYASPAEAYLGGLLHDLGKPLLLANFPKEYGQVLSQHPAPDQLTALEREALGICHTEASALLIRHWRLQESVAEAIEHHHQAPADGDGVSLAGLIQLANLLSRNLPDSPEVLTSTDAMPLTAADLDVCRAKAVETVEDIARAMGITVEQDNDPAGPGKAGAPDAAIRKLRDQVRLVTSLHGALDNLLKAREGNRICQVLEETLRMLFELRHCFLLLPVGENGASRPLLSPSNPLLPHSGDIPLPGGNAPSILWSCQDESTIRHATMQGDSGQMSPADRELAEHLGCEALLAVSVPLGETQSGVLVVGLSEKRLQQLIPSLGSLRLLAAHVGARLQLERLSRQRSADLARKELEGVVKVARTIAHEIANPLAIIQNYLAVLERKSAEGKDTGHDIRLISAEIGRISAITRQLENISDLTSSPAVSTMRLDHLLRDVLTFFRESIFQPRKIEVSIKLQPETRSLAVPADTIRQVLTILFANAADALAEGGRIDIGSSLEQAGSHDTGQMLRLTIADNGPGVAPEMIRAIFNAGITTKADGHLGLGLSIARKLLLDREGDISYAPPTAGGACFAIRLPTER